jgi:hypothetical protein
MRQRPSVNLEIKWTSGRTLEMNNCLAASLAPVGGMTTSVSRDVLDFESIDDLTVVDNNLGDPLNVLLQRPTTDCYRRTIGLVSGKAKKKAHRW